MNLTFNPTSLYIECQRLFDHTWRRFKGVPLKRFSQITPQLYVGGQYSQSGLNTLKTWGVTSTVSMRTRSSLDLDKLGWHNYLHIPVVDKTSPSIKQLEEGVKFIKKEIDSGGSVYVHCYWGEGRGPTMAAAYLISTGLTSDAALAVIKKVRPFIRPSLSQIDCLQKFQQIYL